MIRSLSIPLTFALVFTTIASGQQSGTAPAGQNAAASAKQSATAPAKDTPAPFSPPDKIFGYRNPAAELQAEKTFLAVPDPQLAKQHLQTLTAAPHVAGSPEDRRTAEYVLQKYKAAGLDAYIQEYKIWMALPLNVRVDMVAPPGVVMHGPSPERVKRRSFPGRCPHPSCVQ